MDSPIQAISLLLRVAEVGLWLEAVRQGVGTAVRVVWLSDGGRGFWTVFQRCFQAVGATAILDFYHAAQNLYKGATAGWMGGLAPANSGLPRYVTGCATAMKRRC